MYHVHFAIPFYSIIDRLGYQSYHPHLLSSDAYDLNVVLHVVCYLINWWFVYDVPTQIKKENNDNRDELIHSLRVEIEELRSKNKRLWQELDNCRHRYGHVTSNSINSLYSSKGDGKSKY